MLLRKVVLIVFFALSVSELLGEQLKTQLRRPVALGLSDDGQWLYVANQESGTISIVECASKTVRGEIDVGGRLADLTVVDDEHLLILDEQRHELVLLAGGMSTWTVQSRLSVPIDPRQIQVNRTSEFCVITSLWSRAVTRVDLSGIKHGATKKLVLDGQLQLDFEPRELCFSNDERSLIVAGAFNGVLAVVDMEELTLKHQTRFPGHNIRGLTISPDGHQLYVSFQFLNSLGHSTRDDIHWGNMVSNLFGSLPFEELKENDSLIEKRLLNFRLGGPDRGAGDPGQIVFTPAGQVAIILCGVNELAISTDSSFRDVRRMKVGAGPSAIVADNDDLIYVANRYSDSVSVVNASGGETVPMISLGPRPSPDAVAQGEQLFFDAQLSHDGWLSCHSCHSNGHTNERLSDNFSDGSFGAPKRVLSLLGVGKTAPWAWNGQVNSLEEQIRNSIELTMQGSPPTDNQVQALVAYLETLEPPPSLLNRDNETESKIDAGAELFQKLDCQRCHAPPDYTSSDSYDVGLSDSYGSHLFNPPSLRGVGHRQSLFHDGRANSVEDAIQNYKHQLKKKLSDDELKSLLVFLNSL